MHSFSVQFSTHISLSSPFSFSRRPFLWPDLHFFRRIWPLGMYLMILFKIIIILSNYVIIISVKWTCCCATMRPPQRLLAVTLILSPSFTHSLLCYCYCWVFYYFGIFGCAYMQFLLQIRIRQYSSTNYGYCFNCTKEYAVSVAEPTIRRPFSCIRLHI